MREASREEEEVDRAKEEAGREAVLRSFLVNRFSARGKEQGQRLNMETEEGTRGTHHEA